MSLLLSKEIGLRSRHVRLVRRKFYTSAYANALKTVRFTPSSKLWACILGLIVVGLYFGWASKRYYSLDTVPSDPVVITPRSLGSTAGGQKTTTSSSPNTTGHNSSSTTPSSPVVSSSSAKQPLLLNDDQINNKLRELEQSYTIHRSNGVLRYDIAQLPSNCPIEDDHAEDMVLVPILQNNNIKTLTDWVFFGIFDGHGGWTTSAKLRERLIPSVIQELTSIFKPVSDDDTLRYVPNSATIDQAIKNGFLKLDHEIVNGNIERLLRDNSKLRAAELLMPALLGLCALLLFYDTNSRLLKVALTGDSRALLGSFRDNQWTVRQLSVDQTGSSPSEVARIISEHPNEPAVIRNGRVLGSLEPTRAFGDCRYKLPAATQNSIYQQFFGRRMPNNLHLPPYVTAEPVVTSTKINPENNDFMVMASDGLYEMLTNEEIAALVVKWMEKEKMIRPQTSFWNVFRLLENKLGTVIDCTPDPSSKQPIRRRNGQGLAHFMLEDKNVLTHLLRNALALGGSREEISMLLSIPNPVSRRYRDDLSVTVVFFGENAEVSSAGNIELNVDATRGGKGLAPKL